MQAVGNEDLYKIVAQMTVAATVFSVHETELNTLSNLIRKRYKKEEEALINKEIKYSIAALVASIIVGFIAPPIGFTVAAHVASVAGVAGTAGMATAGAAAVTGTGALVYGGASGYEVYKTKGKSQNASERKEPMPHID